MKISLLRDNAKVPVYATQGSVGADLFAAVDRDVWLRKGAVPTLVPTGIAIELEPPEWMPAQNRWEYYEAQVRPRSGLSKRGVHVAVGTIDADFRGHIHACMWTTGQDYIIHAGDRIAQLVVSPVIRSVFQVTDCLSVTARGAGGFGSTGR